MSKLVRKSSPVRKAIDQTLSDVKTLTAKVGYFPSAKYPDGTPIAYVASIQEYGVPSKSIPARPTFRPVMDSQRTIWQQMMAQLSKRVMNGKMSVRESFDAIGLVAAGEVRAAISTLTTPVLKHGTIAARVRRGNSSVKPLVDTGMMLAHLTNVTESK